MDAGSRELVAFVEARVREDLAAAVAAQRPRSARAQARLLALVRRAAGRADGASGSSPSVDRALRVIASGHATHADFRADWLVTASRGEEPVV